MAAQPGQLEISYGAFLLVFDTFVDGELPRTFVETAALSRSVTGTQVYSGAPYSAKYLWTINSRVTTLNAEELYLMFRAFDNERSTGGLPQIAIDDYTFMTRVTGQAVFTTAPTISRQGAQSQHMVINFGMSEV